MLYNLEWLKEGQTFPPLCEVERLAEYKDSRQLFDGNTEQVLYSYKQRINEIIYKLDINTQFKTDINYHRLITMKTADMVCGEMPTITSKNDEVSRLIKNTNFKKKLYGAVCDISRLGESIARILYKQDLKRNDFIITSPDAWFPIVNREDLGDYKAHVLAWVEELPGNSLYNPKHILKAQIHEKGRFINREFELKNMIGNNQININMVDGKPEFSRNLNVTTYTIGKEITKNAKYELTGLNDYAIVPLQNILLPDSVYAYNDYGPITSLVAELEVRVMLENAVLDKHTAPTLYADSANFIPNPMTGQREFATGRGVMVEEGGTIPGYVVWDASLQANHEMITLLKQLLYSISEMGAVINDEAFGASQGYEALMTRLTSARMKARRISDNLTDGVAKLIDLVSQNGYERIKAEDISIVWNDGIPDTEIQNIDIAMKKLSLFPIQKILMEHFGLTEEKALECVDALIEQQSLMQPSSISFGAGENG